MRIADRVKSWLRKLGPSDDAAGTQPSSTQQSSAAQEVAAGSQEGLGVQRNLPQPSPVDQAQASQPSPPPAPPAPAAQLEPAPPGAPQAQPQRAAQAPQQTTSNGVNGKSMLDTRDFFAEAVHAEANRYSIKEVIGKGSYGVVCSAIDNFTGEKVAIKKITNVFEHVSDATRIVREIKLLRLLKHPDIVDIKHIMLPPSPKDFKDIYVVFELLETDLHQVIKANDDLTPEHHQFFLYQMLRGLKYIHSAKVFHRDLKPKNILANSDCKLKICDFGLARPAFNDMPTTVFWTDYVATRWYRAPELCGSFFAKYSPAIDIWSVGCIFAEVLLGKPLFPGRNVVHQLELITDLLGTPSQEVIAKVRNEKARRFLLNMRPKTGVPFEQHFPRADRGALRLLRRLLAFDPAERPTAEEALADPYFTGLHCVAREPVAQPLSKMAFEFDRRKLTLEDVRELIYREILEYHPQMLKDYLAGASRPNFHYPSALESFKRQFAHLEAGGAPLARAGQPGPRIYPSSSLPKEWVAEFQAEAAKYITQQPSASHGGAVGGGGATGAIAAAAAPPGSYGGADGVPSAVAPPAAAVAAAAQPQRPSAQGFVTADSAASVGGGAGGAGAVGAYTYAYDAEIDGVYDMVTSPAETAAAGGAAVGPAVYGPFSSHAQQRLVQQSLVQGQQEQLILSQPQLQSQPQRTSAGSLAAGSLSAAAGVLLNGSGTPAVVASHQPSHTYPHVQQHQQVAQQQQPTHEQQQQRRSASAAQQLASTSSSSLASAGAAAAPQRCSVVPSPAGPVAAGMGVPLTPAQTQAQTHQRAPAGAIPQGGPGPGPGILRGEALGR